MKILSVLIGCLMGHGALSAAQPDLDWLAGAWCEERPRLSIEEHWLPMKGGLMLGVNRAITASKTAFEFLRIEFSADGVRYIAQPGGEPPVVFDLVSAGDGRVTFANPRHDFPKRVHYKREGALLTARVDDGRDEGAYESFRWRRCAAVKEEAVGG